MKKENKSIANVVIRLALTAFLAGLLLFQIAENRTRSFGREAEQKLGRFLESAMQKYNIPGAVVGVWQGDKKAWVRAEGVSDITTKRKIKAGDRFRIASNTKTFVAVAVLRLVDEGKLSLDDTLSKFIPEISNAAKITVRQLLNHTSGVYDFINDAGMQNDYRNNPLRKWTPQEEIALILKHEPEFAPGEKWHYSNSNYEILGVIIEKVTGQKVERVVQEKVIGPLKLKKTSFPETPEMTGKFSRGYMDADDGRSLKDITLTDPSLPWAGGAMISNLYDLKTWAQAAAKGALLSDAMKKEHLAWVETGMKRFGYGLGICDIHGFIGHNGGILGYASVMLYSPEKDATIVVWFNKCNDDGKGNPEIEIAGEIIKTLFGDR